MNKNEIINSITGTASKIGFSLKEHSPEILVTTGVIGVVASTILACKATTKIETILDEHNDVMDKIHEQPTDDPEVYSEDDKKKDTLIVYTQTGVKLAKLYAPAVLTCAVSIGCIVTSNNILRKRSVAFATAYAVTDKAFKEYRKRVVDKYGEAVDKELRFNTKKEEIEETVVDENGKEKTKKKKADVVAGGESGYMRYFTRSNPNWEDDSTYLETFLRMQQAYANDLLRAKKHLTLNEVYEMLGFKESKAGMVVGWIFDLDNPNGDNYIEFDVKEVYIPDEFTGQKEKAYAIDFNVDGSIYEKMI